jgi:ubiquinone biosynthesis monooxygenase Coq7
VHRNLIEPTPLDRGLAVLQSAVAVIAGRPASSRPDPGATERIAGTTDLDEEEKRRSAALMRVNHVGEICAQALYEAQALTARDTQLRGLFQGAAQEESDHLAWTRGRVEQLGGRTSALVPLWYAGAFAIGCAASALGDRASLGFMAETERQVEQHLLGHLDRLPPKDRVSRAIVEQMKVDESGHAQQALHRGAQEMPLPVRLAMKLAARVMTTTAYYI